MSQAEIRFNGSGTKRGTTSRAIIQTVLQAQLAAQGLTVIYLYVSDIGGFSGSVISPFELSFPELQNRIHTALNNTFDSLLEFEASPIYNAGGGTEQPTTTTTTTNNNTYTVKSGDTLSKIGAKLGVNWQTIAALNGIAAPYIIRVGQVLKVSGGGTATTPAPVIIQPQNLPPILTNNGGGNNPQPQPQKKLLSNFFDTDTGKLTGIGIAALILVGGIVLTSGKRK